MPQPCAPPMFMLLSTNQAILEEDVLLPLIVHVPVRAGRAG